MKIRVISLPFFRIQSTYPSLLHKQQDFYLRSGILESPLPAESLILLKHVPKSEQHALVFTMQCNCLKQEHGTHFQIPSSPLSDGYSVQVPTDCTANAALFMYFIWHNVIIRFMPSKYSAYETERGKARR